MSLLKSVTQDFIAVFAIYLLGGDRENLFVGNVGCGFLGLRLKKDLRVLNWRIIVVGKIKFQNQEYELRDYPYRDEDDNLVCPLLPSGELIFGGCYPTSIKYGLDEGANESITMVGNNKKWIS